MRTFFLFDMDNTLTPAGELMEDKVEKAFLEFIRKRRAKNVMIVTGTPISNLKKQLPESILKTGITFFVSMGHERWQWKKGELKGHVLKPNDQLKNDPRLLRDLNVLLNNRYPAFPVCTLQPVFDWKSAIDRERPGMLTFLAVRRPRNDDKESDYLKARETYFDWDKKQKQRQKFADYLRQRHADKYVISVSGKTSIDITPKDSQKDQVLEALMLNQNEKDLKLILIADETKPGGNDYSLAKAILKRGGNIISVQSPADTLQILRQ